MCNKANQHIFIDYVIDMTKSLSISYLSINLFKSKYYKNNISSITNPNLYNNIKNALLTIKV